MAGDTLAVDVCSLVMNADSRVRFAGVLDKNGRLVEGGMKENTPSLLPKGKDDLLFLRTVSQLKELQGFRGSLGDVSHIFIRMEKVSLLAISLKGGRTLLVSIEPDADPSFVVPILKAAVPG